MDRSGMLLSYDSALAGPFPQTRRSRKQTGIAHGAGSRKPGAGTPPGGDRTGRAEVSWMASLSAGIKGTSGGPGPFCRRNAGSEAPGPMASDPAFSWQNIFGRFGAGAALTPGSRLLAPSANMRRLSVPVSPVSPNPCTISRSVAFLAPGSGRRGALRGEQGLEHELQHPRAPGSP